MPLYVYRCKQCDAHEESFRPSHKRNDFPTHCNQPMVRDFTPTRFNMPKLNYERQLDENRKRAEVVDDHLGQSYDWDTGKSTPKSGAIKG